MFRIGSEMTSVGLIFKKIDGKIFFWFLSCFYRAIEKKTQQFNFFS